MYTYGYADWELQTQTYLLVGTLFLLKLFSLPLLLPWLRRPFPKQTLKMSWYLEVKKQRGAMYVKGYASFAKIRKIR